MTESLIHRALDYATNAHDGQKRKYTGEPYINHPIRVAELVSTTTDGTVEAGAAALLHDVVEDTGISISTIQLKFGIGVAGLVEELTDRLPTTLTDASRAERKAYLVKRWRMASPVAQTIKCADVIDNVHDLVPHAEITFAQMYLHEKMDLLQNLTEADPTLRACANLLVSTQYTNLLELKNGNTRSA